jgi:hypothetical protein
MPCLVGCFALFAPRVVLALVWFFDRELFTTAYKTVIWPVLGFIFMPLTTLAYAWVVRRNGVIDGVWWAVVAIAALIDLGLIGKGATSRRSRKEK